MFNQLKKVISCQFTAFLATSALAATPTVTPLWSTAAPGALGTAPRDIPTLTAYLPAADQATGAAMVICPGGAYAGLSSHEGEGYAKWLTENGVAAFVLKYRLGSSGYRHPVMLQDAARALRTVRANAEKWHLNPQKIGIMGSSAGGHLASTLLTHFAAGNPAADDPIDRVSSRPDLGILCYAVITMGPNTHQGSKNNLLGNNPPPELSELLSNEKQVTKDTPPVFIWHTWEDRGVKVENSLDFARALRQNNVPFDLHIYQKGAHGMGLGGGRQKPDIRHPWTQDCLYWLRVQGFVK